MFLFKQKTAYEMRISYLSSDVCSSDLLMLRSIKENPLRLEYTGVNVFAYKMAGFVISALYAGIAGSLMVIYEPYVATKYLYWSTSGEVVIMSVIGGVGTLIGRKIGRTSSRERVWQNG